jgi:prepilin-type N-terminal cleavage/methylation domain-containing protein/prepilin-type processing-associated H-X9-DG protein
MKRGFTLVELLVVITIIAILGAISAAVYGSVKRAAYNARCVAALSQLGAATGLYLGDNGNRFFPYAQNTAEGKVWYFGLETSPGGSEGERELDASAGPLAPYIGDGGRIEVCPAFNYGSALWKPKFKGASWGYGYNWRLGGGPSGRNPKHITDLSKLGEVVVFGDCGQINTFQSPASPDNPLLEEFYIINESFKTVHFRHGKHANFLFADGHVDSLPVEPGTRDERLKAETLGRITPVGSLRYLE